MWVGGREHGKQARWGSRCPLTENADSGTAGVVAVGINGPCHKEHVRDGGWWSAATSCVKTRKKEYIYIYKNRKQQQLT